MVIICPITLNIKDFSSHYILEDTKYVFGAVLCELLEVLIMKKEI